MSIKSVLLTSVDLAFLARMPLTSGSCPRLNSRSEETTFRRLYDLGLIVGAEGCYGVRWGILSLRQYDRVCQLRAGMTDYERFFGREVAK